MPFCNINILPTPMTTKYKINCKDKYLVKILSINHLFIYEIMLVTYLYLFKYIYTSCQIGKQ